MKYYIASALENAEQVKALKKMLDAAGHEHTYDWTVHGSVQTCGTDRIAEVAMKEAEGVITADVVVVLLRGGRGTHTELGIAIGTSLLAVTLAEVGIVELTGTRRICIFSPSSEEDFGTTGKTCAFYHHPLVEKFTDYDEMVGSLLGAL